MTDQHTCSGCSVTKPLSEFGLRHDLKTTRPNGVCRECKANRRRERMRKHRDGEQVMRGRTFVVYGDTRTCTGCKQALSPESFTPFRDPLGRRRLKPRCRKCVAQQQKEYRWAAGVHKKREPKSETKVCRACHQELPRTSFEQAHGGDRHTFERAQCKPCVSVRKKAQRAAKAAQRPPKPKAEPKPRAVRPAPAPRPLHPCITCGVGLSTSAVECFPCKRARNNLNHVSSDQKVRDRTLKNAIRRLKDGTYAALLWLNDHEAWGMIYHCQGCAKPMMLPGNCWSCATGLPRVLRRPDGSPITLPRVQFYEEAAAA